MDKYRQLAFLVELNERLDEALTEFGAKFRIKSGDIKWKSSGATMTPDEFLGKSLPLENPNADAVQKYENMIQSGQEIEAPQLWVKRSKKGLSKYPHPSQYEVTGHEGRHRAIAARRAGVKHIPVEIVAPDEPRVPRRNKFVKKALKLPRHFSPERD
ncbi:hypothetical protein EBZ80_10450 [bacterium]|nr:hypothetical protein [bacterium]